VGPQIGLHVLSGNIYKAGDKYKREEYILSYGTPRMMILILYNDRLKRNRDFSDFIFSIAPVIGMDFFPSDTVTVSVDAGLRACVHMNLRNSPAKNSMYRYEGFLEASVLLRIMADTVQDE